MTQLTDADKRWLKRKRDEITAIQEACGAMTDEDLLRFRTCRDLRAVPDGYPTGGGGSGRGTSETSSTEAAALARLDRLAPDPVGDAAHSILLWISNTAKSSSRAMLNRHAVLNVNEDVKGRQPTIKTCDACDHICTGVGSDRIRRRICDACRQEFNRERRLNPTLDLFLWIRRKQLAKPSEVSA